MNASVLRRCPLFEDLTDDEIGEALSFYGAAERPTPRARRSFAPATA